MLDVSVTLEGVGQALWMAKTTKGGMPLGFWVPALEGGRSLIDPYRVTAPRSVQSTTLSGACQEGRNHSSQWAEVRVV